MHTLPDDPQLKIYFDIFLKVTCLSAEKDTNNDKNNIKNDNNSNNSNHSNRKDNSNS